ncbi:MAG: tetratricopeptide repeat protein [Myxococcota bacterium]
MTQLLLAMFLAFGPAFAQDEEEDDLSENTITQQAGGGTLDGASQDALEAFLNRPYESKSYIAAEALKSDVKMIEECRKAVEAVYLRDYKGAKKQFDAVAEAWPTTGMGPLGRALLYQALMFENFDFRYEKQYKSAFDDTKRQLEKGRAAAGDEALESFVLAALLGMDAIHFMRKGEFLAAINRGVEATKALETTKKLAPTFADAALGDGLYLYWRSAITRNSKVLPDFPDKRQEGLELMKKAEREAAFLGPGATLALAYSWIEERDLRRALDRSLQIRLAYPDNIINNMTLGRIYTSMRRYDDALRMYDEVLADEKDHQRSHYHRGIVLARLGRYPEAQKAYETYLGFKDLTKDARGQTYYRLGALHVRQKQADKAEAYFKQAVATNGNEAAKRALERLKQKP